MSITSFTAAQISADAIQVEAASDLSLIVVEYSDDNSNWNTLGSIAAEGGTLNDNGPFTDVALRYYRGTDDGGSSYATAEATRIPPPQTAPSVNATQYSPSEIGVGWDQPAYATHITVWRRDVYAGGADVQVWTGDITQGGISDTQVKIGRVYQYFARTANQWGNGPESSPYLAPGCRPMRAEDSPDPGDVKSGAACLASDLLTVTTGSYNPLAAAVFPDEADVSDTVTAYGPTGTEYAGAFPLADYVARSEVVAAADVLLDVPRWIGATGDDLGTNRLPPVGKVESGYHFGPADALTGTLVASTTVLVTAGTLDIYRGEDCLAVVGRSIRLVDTADQWPTIEGDGREVSLVVWEANPTNVPNPGNPNGPTVFTVVGVASTFEGHKAVTFEIAHADTEALWATTNRYLANVTLKLADGKRRVLWYGSLAVHNAKFPTETP